MLLALRRISHYPADPEITVCTFLYHTGLFEMIVGVITTCHTQYTRDSSLYLHR